jgi:hypothetical protein
LLNIGRRTWIKQAEKIAFLVFCLNSSHTGYIDLVHGGILAALVNKSCAEYYNRGAVTLYFLTKYLGVDFKRLSFISKVFIAKVFTSQLFLLIVSDLRKV